MTAVVVLHYDRVGLTADCCATLAAQQGAECSVLVVDNGSPSHSADDLRAALPAGVRVLRLDPNRGFGGGMNAGIREALLDPAADAVLLLNNDTRCPPGLVAAMRAALEADPAVGMVGCDMEGAGGGESSPAGHRLGRVFGYPRPCRPGEAPDYLQGSCLLLPRDVLVAVGGFDEDYRFYFEDADLSLRVRRLGRRLAVAPGVRLLHYGSATIGANDGIRAAWFRTGHRVFLRKWYSRPRLRALPPFLAALARNLLLFRLRAAAGAVRGYLEPIPSSVGPAGPAPVRRD